MPSRIDPQALRRVAADLRDFAVTETRAAELALEVARVNDAARAEGAKNDFNAQPTDYAVTLAGLAKR